jgi:hypothetical protein
MSYGFSYIEIEKGAVIFIVLSLSHVMHRRENYISFDLCYKSQCDTKWLGVNE